MMARSLLGGFIPSNGVGTGYSRRALEGLAARHNDQIFEPACLTEDYENGFRIAALGLRQKFIPIRIHNGRSITTREFFPRDFRAAVRQRTRWVTGITLQSWEYHSLRETIAQAYWFWRDRKGLLVNFSGPLANLIFLGGALGFLLGHTPHLPALFVRVAPLLVALQIVQISVRTGCSARIYGWRFAAFAPLRIIAAIWINGFAACRAVADYAQAKWRGNPLRWHKTDHAYPDRADLMMERRFLGDILAAGQWISHSQLADALATQPSARRLGEHLLSLGLIDEYDLYAALSVQNNLPLACPEPEDVSVAVTRALPAGVARKWRVLPFRIAAGELYVAGAEIPGDEMHRDIRRFSSLEIRFQLVTPSDYEELAAKYLAAEIGN